MKKTVSLTDQLLRIILSVTLVSTFLAFSFSIIYDFRSSLTDLRTTMHFTARQIADNLKSPLLFRDHSGAQDLISSFESIPTVLSARVFDSNDTLFAIYIKDPSVNPPPSLQPQKETAFFTGKELHISVPILQEGRPFGHFDLHVSTGPIIRKLLINAGIFMAVFLVIMGISYVVALRLQRVISGPILQLKNLAEHITRESDYTTRIPHTCDNEIGELQQSLDTMVRQLDKNILSLRTEIDDRIRLQHEAQHLRTYLKNIIDSISSVIIAVNEEGLVQQLNLEALKFLGGDESSYLLHEAASVIPVFKGREEFLRSCINDNKPDSFFVVYNHPVETPQRFLNVLLFPLSQREREGMVLVIDDITEKTHMETMMMQSEKMLSLGGLAAGMAHEINNPLGIISQGIQNILSHLQPDRQRNREAAADVGIDAEQLYRYLENRKVISYLNGMHHASKRASEIITNMLQFSRMQPHSKIRIRINELIDQTIELARNEYELKKKYEFKTVTIIRNYDKKLPTLYCNATEIQQVLLNLLKNAAYALHEKKADGFTPEITLTTTSIDGQIKIEVADNGPGIPESISKRILEPFFTTKEVGVGTGLGLSVSFFIITKNHGGTLTFKSEKNQGTSFTILLPIN
ncbi:MAG: HAMP domain-containing protein [Chitinispirillaceae bacterium]|nr:HAMP domain-containing protein [Chitinispirillaceae bacterium]